MHLESCTSEQKKKPPPNFHHIQPKPTYDYHHSPDGIDSNLLILLHGLGDTHTPFSQLAKKLKLPQTAILALRAFERVPIIEQDAHQWWDSFDFTGSIITHPNPTKTLDKLIQILDQLISQEGGGWNPERIHLFGFAQGGTCVAELGLYWQRRRSDSISRPLASIVSISGPLLSLPTIPTTRRSSTPILLWKRVGEDLPGKWRIALERGYQFVHQFIAPQSSSHHEQMPTTPQEWQPILQFWSKLIKSQHPWESNDESTFVVRST